MDIQRRMDGYDEIIRKRPEESSRTVERVGVDQKKAQIDVHVEVHGHRDEEYCEESIPKKPMRLVGHIAKFFSENIPTPDQRSAILRQVFAMTREEVEALSKLIRGTISLCDHQIDALFDSSSIRSFISDDCAKRLKLHVLEMLFSINVSTLAGVLVRTNQACLKLELKFGDRVTVIDLICLPLSGINVIVRMDWLFANGATLDSLQVEKSVKKGCQAFMIYCSTHEMYDGGIDRIGVVNEFPKMFDNKMSGLPLEREIKFSIHLVPSTKPISKVLYRMAPAELEELKKQLE
ncbi:uncharacterized protein LOC129294951 [Prosopis cineraria]|uniref:uncharacterized protein LOC129294951 n=1 Tax=Prosopis cineraria TaxID=364024 RepID=UPI0024105523|nr:uncharacterized protein LOC129294951 [Prosopis cineraria]